LRTKKVDIKEVINLANTHPRVNIHKPGPGVGGPCLTKDPYLLMYGIDSKTKNLIKTAREINDYMPTHLVNLVQDAMEQTQRKIRQSTISILGTSYKADVDDGRFSPSEKIIKELLKLNAKVIAYDPLCKDTFGAKKGLSLFQTVRGSDCLVVLTDHSEFKNINLEKIKELMTHNPAIIDGKRIIKSNEATKLGFLYYGVGYTGP
jgi:UDP-N-acetyl-D-mannosaminuronic acid dehydrogenase